MIPDQLDPSVTDFPDHGSGNEQVFVVQPVLLPRRGFPRELYMETEPNSETEASGNELIGEPGEALSFNSYFNAFYLSYWRQHTTIGRVGLRLRITGKFTLSVFVSVPGRDERRILEHAGEMSAGDPASVVTWLPDEFFGPEARKSGRLYFSLKCDGGCRIQEIDYVTDVAPSCQVSLSIGLCTFNREDFLAVNVQELETHRANLPELREVIVVNQGKPFRHPDLLQGLTDLGAQTVEQANLGGTGGFCRTIFEACSITPAATHHLLMDDDILLDARVIRKALDFLSFARKDIAVGGSMFEIHRPTVLHEAASCIGPRWVINSVGRRKDLKSPDNIKIFDQAWPSDFNAWWFCIVPQSAVEQVGLPMPIFIRGDDVEYGCRMKDAGFETISVPGIAVWHQTFSSKQSSWIIYYDARNLLINASLYPNMGSQPGVLDILGVVFSRLLCHQYDNAWATMRSVQDYLTGPDAVVEPSLDARHQALLSVPTRDLATTLDSADLEVAPAENTVSFPETIRDVVGLFTLRFFQISILSHRNRLHTLALEDVHPGNIGPGSYVVAIPATPETATLYRPSRWQLWIGSIMAFWVVLCFATGRRKAGQRWRDRAKDLTTSRYWERAFGVEPRTRTPNTSEIDRT